MVEFYTNYCIRTVVLYHSILSKLLYLTQIIDIPLCSICNMERERLEYLFLFLPLWKRNMRRGRNNGLNKQMAKLLIWMPSLFCYVYLAKKMQLWIVSCTKWYIIYKQSRCHKPPVFNDIKQLIYNYYVLEKYLYGLKMEWWE